MIRNFSVRSASAARVAENHVDHRAIGQHQSLFMSHPCSAGTVFFLPRGLHIVNKIKTLLRAEYSKYGFQEVQTPLIYSQALYEQSGHLENYKKDMYMLESQRTDHNERGITLGLKPMNCPAHCLIYKSNSHSYRSLPIRIADFSSLHRNEPSGTLTGLTRLREFHQDDAHIFCTNEQVYGEISMFLDMVRRVYIDIFKFESYSVGLSTRPDTGALGTIEEWSIAEETLKKALDDHFGSNGTFAINKGDGAFYGPKIDVQVKDSNGKKFQLATLQLDFQLPKRFDLEYVSNETIEDSPVYKRPVLIHRAVLGSIERFFAVWSESIEGKWPFWCSPFQCMIIPLTENKRFIQSLKDQLSIKHVNDPWSPRFAVDVDTSNASETLSKRIRNAEISGYHYIVVVGEKEIESQVLAVRERSDEGTKHMKMSLSELKDLFIQRDNRLA